MVKNDPEEALKFYLPALADTSDGNGILKRELLEVIPICLSKIGDNNQGTTSILTVPRKNVRNFLTFLPTSRIR